MFFPAFLLKNEEEKQGGKFFDFNGAKSTSVALKVFSSTECISPAEKNTELFSFPLCTRIK